MKLNGLQYQHPIFKVQKHKAYFFADDGWYFAIRSCI
jgi:hypothetical protein